MRQQNRNLANKCFEWDAPTAGFAACFRAPQAKRYGEENKYL